MNEVLWVHKLNSSNHLIRKHQDSLHSEPSRAKVEQVFETRTEKVHDQQVVLTVCSIPAADKQQRTSFASIWNIFLLKTKTLYIYKKKCLELITEQINVATKPAFFLLKTSQILYREMWKRDSPNVRNSNSSLKKFVQFWFVEQLRVSSLHRLELYCNLLI